MKNILIFIICAIVLTSCESNEHLHFVNGVVITRSVDLIGVYLQVDTTFDGTADIATEVFGEAMTYDFVKGDTVSVDVRTRTSYAEPILQ
jgi:hypothetical protein